MFCDMSTTEDTPTPEVVVKGGEEGKGETQGGGGGGEECEYKVDERVLCFHGPLIYEAKVLKHKHEDNIWKYFVHYNGWNKNWDEWVDRKRILKLNSYNRQIQHDLKSRHSVGKNPNHSSNKKRKTSESGINGQPLPTDESNSTSNKRLKNDKSDAKTGVNTNGKDNSSGETTDKKKKGPKVPDFVETEDAFNTKPEIRIKIPEELKPCLVDDWDLITRQQKLFSLPARYTVDQIMDEYLKQKLATKLTPLKESAVNEVMAGLKEYFNAMIGSQLLYRFERMQYQEQLQEIKDKDIKLSSVYGSIHLLRLFTKLGNFLAFTSLDEKTIQSLLIHINDFLKYLSRNASLFSSDDYSVASPEYLRKTLN